MRKLIILFIIVLMSSVVFAAEPAFKFRRDDPIDLKINCDNNGTICPSVGVCNITINRPDGTNLVKRHEMTNQAEYFNYTLTASNMTGIYSAMIFCDYSGNYTNSNFNFEISSAGGLDVSPLTIIVAYGIIAGLLLFLSFKIDDRHILLRILFIVISVLLIIVAIPSALVAENVLMSVYKMSQWVFYLFIAYIILYTFYYVMTTLLNRQTPEDDENE